jgi:hypothetical protein
VLQLCGKFAIVPLWRSLPLCRTDSIRSVSPFLSYDQSDCP